MSAPMMSAPYNQDETAPDAMMKAIINRRYGSPDVLELAEMERPAIGEDGVLVRVRAASVNPLDWHFIRGEPRFVRAISGLRRPKEILRGVDLAGIVEAVGANVTEFRPGDEVFGGRDGALAEYVSGRERNFVLKPASLTFEQAAAIAVAGCTAVQALRDHGQLQPGQRVLINGAAGGVGTFAVQLAKVLGGHVTGVCSSRNVEMVRSIGANEVVDYTGEDFTRSSEPYDLILDIIGNHSFKALRRILTPQGTLVLVGGESGHWIKPLPRLFRARIVSRFVDQKMINYVAKIRKEDLLLLKELAEAGKLTPVIDRTYSLSETADAIRYLEAGHARGKVVVSV